jgi:outer membrane protein OmpA-like peptidoglycan-associated protein
MTRLPAILCCVAFLAAACATPSETYVVMPDRAGMVTPVTVTARGGQSLVLDKPYAAAAGGAAMLESVSMDKATVDKEFGTALAAQPLPPSSFLLYFSDGDELTADSKLELEKVFAEIAARPAADIVVVGHTDRIGSLEDNDTLSKRRAEKVRLELINRGIAGDNIQAAGRGEREPLVPTADEVREARNRRVEINVR